MKATHRRAAAAVGLFVLPLAGPAFAQQQQPLQRGGKPKDDTPYILVAAFNAPDRKLAVDAADELRRRLQLEHTTTELYVLPKNIIESNLVNSGYRPDSALSPTDLMELSKQLRGEYAIDGKATKGEGKAVTLEARILLRTGQVILAQPLPPANGRDVGDAAKILEKSIDEALKSVKPYKDCITALRGSKYDEAEKNARAGIALYPKSSINRVCLLQAQGSLKAPADSIIATANALLAVDAGNMQALANLVDAYKAKGETEQAINTNIRIWKLDPTNSSIAQSIIRDLATSGAPDKALPIVDTLLKENPGDPQFLNTKWILEGRVGQYKKALATGLELMKIDSVAKSQEFYDRQLAFAQADSNTPATLEWAGKAEQKFPAVAKFPQLLANGYLKSGQTQQALDAARRAIKIDPKEAAGWQFALAAANQLNQPDTVLAIGKDALAAGVDASKVGPFLAGVPKAAVEKAQASKTREDWETAFKTSQLIDSIAPTETSKFFLGLSAFQVGVDAFQHIQELNKDKNPKTMAASKAAACAETKVLEDQFANAQIAMPRGASLSRETAGSVMTNIQQLSEYIPQFKKAFCTGK